MFLWYVKTIYIWDKICYIKLLICICQIAGVYLFTQSTEVKCGGEINCFTDLKLWSTVSGLGECTIGICMCKQIIPTKTEGAKLWLDIM